MRYMIVAALIVTPFLPARGFAEEPADTRVLWVYEGGWFAKDKDDLWIELNDETYRRQGKPSQFREVKRTKELV
jgi:hypothetical protein